ncbi:retrovirus-related Pol polyprotein from transposon 17.6 [Trichonephila clavipes]|nr:retrovirus-related Pol polyprotein from transposon 17.6 [Trichonephila clavipes]
MISFAIASRARSLTEVSEVECNSHASGVIFDQPMRSGPVDLLRPGPEMSFNRHSRIDLVKAHYPIAIHTDDIHKTAICTPFGLFESTRMQFGLCNASATFQRFIDEVTGGLPGIYAFVDDILIASKSSQEHYRQCFIPKAAHILAPIVQFLERDINKKKSHSSVLKSSKPLKWNENAEKASLAAKNAIAEATLLRHPIPGAQLSLWVDASDIAIGRTLSQLSQGKWEPIAFFSMKLNKSQQRWSTYDRELFSIYSAIKKFKHMLEGRNFVTYIDQKPLIYVFKQNPNKCFPRQLRHLDLISQYSTDIRHVQGSENTVADALSRIEIDSITNSPILNFKEFALAQKNDPDLQKFLQTNGSSLKL